MQTLDAGFGWTLVYTIIEPSSTRPFDPEMHTDPEVQLAPRWFSKYRRATYRRSRKGRDAQ